MTRARKIVVGALVAAAVLSAAPAMAQTFGLVEGRVRDATGAVLPGATVTVSNEKTGLVKTATTNEQGLFRVLTLNPDTYLVKIELQGFRPVTQQAIVGVAESVTVNATLEVATVSETVQVSAEAPIMNTANAEISQTVDARRVNELPLNGRDFTRLAMLTPGAVQSSNFVASVSFNGTGSAQNNFMLDGIDATRIDNFFPSNGWERGSRLQTASVESVQEFRVLTTNYSAEFGRAAGAVINAITKSGTNTFHGSAYTFIRDDAMDARNFFDTKDAVTGRDKPQFNLYQYGGSLGGPILRDRLFFFTNYEGSRKKLGATVTGTVPTQSFRNRAVAAVQPLLKSIPLPTSATSNPDIGNVAFAEVTDVNEDIFSTRVDYRLKSGDLIYARYNIQDSEVLGPLYVVIPAAFSGQEQWAPITTQSFTTSWVKTIRSNLLNEAKFGMNRFKHLVEQRDPDSGMYIPTTVVTGITVQPGNVQSFGGLNMSYEFTDTLSWFKGAHSMKTGVNLRRITVDLLNTTIQTITYPSMDAFALNVPTQFTATPDVPMTYIKGWTFSGFFQDDIRVSSRLTMNAGLRYDYNTPWDDTDGRLQNFNLDTMTLDGSDVPLYSADGNNLAPRLGTTYDLFGNGKTVVRGGYGIYYNAYAAQSAYQLLFGNLPGATLISRQTDPDLAYPVDLSAGVQLIPSRRSHVKERRDNFNHQWNANVQQQLGRNMSVQVGYVGNYSLANERNYPENLINPATGTRPDTRYSQITVVDPSGKAKYHGLSFVFNKRFSGGWSLNSSYVYSQTKDDIVSPQDPARWDLEWGTGNLDIPHNFTINGMVELPFGPGKRFGRNTTGVWAKVIEGWQVNALASARSGLPYTVTLGAFTMSGTGWTTNQRPNAVAGATAPTPDGPTGWLNPAAYSLPAARTYGDLPRNSERGPTFFQLDASLIKTTQLGGGRALQFRAEVFNALNMVNFAQPSANWRATTTFGRIFNTFGRTESAGTARQIQLALRFTF
jgi:hypothetical protein